MISETGYRSIWPGADFEAFRYANQWKTACSLMHSKMDGKQMATSGIIPHQPSCGLCQHTHTQFSQTDCSVCCWFFCASFVVFLQLPQPTLLHMFIYKCYSFRKHFIFDFFVYCFLPSCLICLKTFLFFFILSRHVEPAYYCTLKIQYSRVFYIIVFLQ